MTFAQLVGIQLALLMRSRRPWFLLTLYTMICLCILLSLVVLDFDPVLHADAFFGTAGTALGMIIAIAWAAMVWRDEGPRLRSYHWSLPVDTSTHDVARAVAGALWQVVGVTWYVVLSMIILSLHGRGIQWIHEMHPLMFVTQYTTALLAYCAAMSVSTSIDHPAEWILGGSIGISMLAASEVIRPVGTFFDFVFSTRYGVNATLYENFSAGLRPHVEPLSQWLSATLLWTAIVAALFMLALLKNRRTLRS